MSTVIFDASALDQRLCRVDPEGDLIDYISASYDGEPYAVMIQVDKLQHCDPGKIRNRIIHSITVSDEELAKFIMQCGSDVPHLDRVMDDPYDLVILAYQKIHGARMLISCDRRLLYVAEHLDLRHRCFKAALHDANISLDSGIIDDPAYHTDEMFVDGSDPFFHYLNNRYCGVCDKRKQCACHR
jgi:hypothetical protein